jgi:hypothetical protein
MRQQRQKEAATRLESELTDSIRLEQQSIQLYALVLHKTFCSVMTSSYSISINLHSSTYREQAARCLHIVRIEAAASSANLLRIESASGVINL